MSIEEIIEEIQGFEDYLDRAFGIGVPPSIDAAIEKLRTHPDAKPNEPLTLESLRGMEGQPVWVTHKDGSGGRWGIVNTYPSGICADVCSGQAYWFEDYVGTIAYRRPPKEA